MHSDLRHRIFSLFHQSADQTLAVETIENAVSTSNSSTVTTLRLAEKILDSQNTFSSFLLSLVYTLLHRPVDAALSLLHVFYSNPSIARVEIAPLVFEELFLIHLIPILQWYNHQRSTIMSLNESAATKSLSTMSREQASQLKDLENEYEEILDENCRVFAGYFKEVLRAKSQDRFIDPPSVIVQNFEFTKDEEMINQELGLKNGRYNVMLALLLCRILP